MILRHMRLSEIANTECCEAYGEYFDAATQKGPVCPTCFGLEESKIETIATIDVEIYTKP